MADLAEDPRAPEAVRDYAAGASFADLRPRYRVSRPTLLAWLAAAGVPVRRREIAEGRELTQEETARLRDLYRARPEMPNVRTRTGEPGRVTQGEGGRPLRDYMRELHASGVQWRDIAWALGVGDSTAHRIAHEYGSPRPGPSS